MARAVSTSPLPGLQIGERDAHRGRGTGHAQVVGGQHGSLAQATQELEGSEVEGVERSDGHRIRLHHAGQNGRDQLQEGGAGEDDAHVLATLSARPRALMCVQTSYSSKRLEISTAWSQNAAAGRRSSASSCASTTDVST